MIASTDWKHQTTEDIGSHGEPVGVDLFDDERPGYTTIYLRFVDGTRYPVRDVNMSKMKYAQSVISAWKSLGKTNNDYRTMALKLLKISVTTENGILLDSTLFPVPIGQDYDRIAFRPIKAGKAEAPDEDTLSIGTQWEKVE